MRGFRPWTVQPPDGTPIDWQNPLAQGLVFAYLPGCLVDLVGGRSLHTVGTAYPLVVASSGRSAKWSGAGSLYVLRDPRLEPAAVTLSALAQVVGTTADNTRIIGKTYQNSGGAPYLSWDLEVNTANGGQNLVNGIIGSSGNYFRAGATLPTTTSPFLATLCYGGSGSAFLYHDAQEVASVSVGGAIEYDTTTTGDLIISGQSSVAASTPLSGRIFLGLVWGRALSGAEMASYGRNPWQLFWKRRRAYSVVASSAVTAALTGVSAATASGTLGPTLSLALTGIAGTSALGTFALAISLSLTGSALTAAQGSLIAPGSTSVALTGVGATIALGSLAQGGSATLSGIAATFAAGSLAVTHSGALTGSGVTSASGTLGASLVLALSGSSAATAQGSLAPAITLALGGNLLASATGYLTAPTGVLVSDPYWSIKRPYVRAFTVSRINGRDFTAKRPYTRTFTVDSMSIQFPIKGISEKVPLTFDFTQDLPSGVTLTGTPTLTVSVTTGTDANPSDILNGSAAFNSASTAVIQGVKGGLNGVGYTITCTSPTTQSNLTLTLVGLLQVRRDPD